VRVILAQHIADDGRALLVAAGGRQAGLLHRVQDPAVDRLETISDIRQRPLHDDAHRVVDERLPHLVLEKALLYPLAPVVCLHVPLFRRI
jgi:hypothetical protein